jgi:hypothetical protein
MLVAVGDSGVILTSSDGHSWSLRDSHTGKDLFSVAAGPVGFVAVGEDGRIVNSRDGISWTVINSPVFTALQRVAFLEGRYFAVGDEGAILISMNGREWIARQIPMPGTEATLGGIAFENGVFVAAGGYRNPDVSARSFIAVSQDAESWSPLDVDFGIKLRAIASHGGLFVAVGNDGAVAVSSDAFRWRFQSLAKQGSNLRAVVALPDDTWVAVGNGGLVLSSEDGSNWTQNRLFTSKNLHDLAFAQNTLYGVATDGLIVACEGLMAKLIPTRPGSAGTLRLAIELGSRDSYTLQASEDLNVWRDVQIFTSGYSTNLFFDILEPAERSFYRLRSP